MDRDEALSGVFWLFSFVMLIAAVRNFFIGEYLASLAALALSYAFYKISNRYDE